MSATDPVVFDRQLRSFRQTRRFTADPVPEDTVRALLEVARWTGSWKNDQPWHFVVVTDPGDRHALSEAGQYADFLRDAPLVIVVVMDGENPRGEPFDEGRVSERLMLAADAHGLGACTAWFAPGTDGEDRVKRLLGIPDGREVRQALGIGYPLDPGPRTRSAHGGRKPLEEIVSRGRWGKRS